MTAASKSIYYFGLYLYVVGLTLIFVPNLLLSTLQMPETQEVWIRIVGYSHSASAFITIDAARPMTMPLQD